MKTYYRKIATMVLALVAFALVPFVVSAQSFTNTGTGNYNATCGAVIKLKTPTTASPAVQATISGNELGTVTKPIPGVVEWAATTGNQVVQNYYYNQLILSGAATKNVLTGVFVLGTQCPTFLPGYTQLEDYPYYVVAASGAVTYNGTFNYAGTSNQNIFPQTNYVTLAVAGAGDATIVASTIVTAENITSASDAPIVVNGTLNVTTGISNIAGGLDINNGGAMTTGAGAVTLSGDVDLVGNATLTTGAGAVTFTNTSTLDLAGTSSLTTGDGAVTANGPVSTLSGTAINVGGQGALTFGNSLNLAGSLIVPDGTTGAYGTVNFDGTTTLASTGILNFGNNSNLVISSAITNAGTGSNLLFNCGSNVTYDGGAGQLILPTGAGSYGNLFLSGGNKVGGTGGTTPDFYYNVSLCGNFDLAGGNLDMYKGGTNSGTLIMTDPAKTATYLALAEVIGSMQRTTSTAASTLVFNNSATSIALGADTDNPTSMTLFVRPGTNPNNYDANKDVNRKITLNYTGNAGAFAMTAQAGYLFGESPTGGWNAPNTQNTVRFYEATASAREKVGTGNTPIRVAAVDGTSFGSVTLAGILNTGTATLSNDIDKFASGNDLLLSAGPTTFYSIADGRWTNPNTWDEGTVPTAIDNAEIRTQVYVGIDGPFIGTDAAGNTTSEFEHYGNSNDPAVKDIVIADKSTLPATNNPALIVGNEDNPATYIFRTTNDGTITNLNTTANNATRATFGSLVAKGTLQAGDIQGVWIVPYTGTNLIPGLGTNSVSNAGNFNNEGILELGN